MKRIFFLVLIFFVCFTSCRTLENTYIDYKNGQLQEEQEKQKEIERENFNKKSSELLEKITKESDLNNIDNSSIDELLKKYIVIVEKTGIKIKNPKKTNMILMWALKDFLRVNASFSEISTFLEINSQFKYEANYIELEKFKEIIPKKMEEIDSYCINYEKNDFKQTFGFLLSDIHTEDIQRFMYPNCNPPEKDKIYIVSDLIVLQNTKDGILIGSPYYPEDFNSFFIFTKKRFVDNHTIQFNDSIYVKYDGILTYRTVIGGTKSVYSFREINFEKYKKKLDSYLFYPQQRMPTDDEYFREFIGAKELLKKHGTI